MNVANVTGQRRWEKGEKWGGGRGGGVGGGGTGGGGGGGCTLWGIMPRGGSRQRVLQSSLAQGYSMSQTIPGQRLHAVMGDMLVEQ